MDYDSILRRSLMQGGGPTGLTDTWAWDGVTWQRIATVGPQGGRSSLAYDAVRRTAVLFGGFLDDETWEFKNEVWTEQVPLSSPRNRNDHTMTFDAARNVTILFGGIHKGQWLGDTWEWDGNRWLRLASAGPTPRANHSMAFDSDRSVAVIFGGNAAPPFTSVGDTWEWNGSTWLMRANSGPPSGGNNGMAYDAYRRLTVLSVFDPSADRNQTWEWDGDEWTRRDTPGPHRRFSFAMAFDSHRGRTVLFGGRDGNTFYGDTWEFGLYPDCDQTTGAGTLDIFDFLCFGNKFEQSDPYACNCDTATGPNICDIFDFLCFQNLFAQCQP